MRFCISLYFIRVIANLFMHKAGFVNIVGNPNVGKSTLMNSLVGERISIITSKAQTTRHRIMGIVNTEDMQIVYSDTPEYLSPTISYSNPCLLSLSRLFRMQMYFCM